MIEQYVNTIQNMDCLEFMKQLPDNCIDLIITSPPYNSGGKNLGYQPNSTVGQKFYGEYDDNMEEKEYSDWIINVIGECLRVSRYVFWNMQFIRNTRSSIFNLQNIYKQNIKDIFIWEKQSVSNITAKQGGLAKGWEYVFMLGRDNLSTFNYNNFPENGYVPNIKTWYKNIYFKEHHATFTIEMCNYFINYFTKKNDIVFDPFLGMATVCLSAVNLGRRFIGTEISKQYFDIATERIKTAQAQGRLDL